MKSWLCHFALQLNKHLNNSFSSIYSYSIYSRCGSAVTFSLTSNREQQKEQVQNHSMLCMLGLGHARRKTLQKLHCRSWPQNRSSHVKWGQKRVVWVRWRPFGLVVNTQGHLSRSVYSCKVEPLHAGNLLQLKEVLYYSRLYYLSKYLASLTTDNVSSLTFLATTLVTKAADVLKHQRFIWQLHNLSLSDSNTFWYFTYAFLSLSFLLLKRLNVSNDDCESVISIFRISHALLIHSFWIHILWDYETIKYLMMVLLFFLSRSCYSQVELRWQ